MQDFHEWAKYFPNEINIRNDESYVDVACYKMSDVYYAFCYFDYNLSLGTNIDISSFVKDKVFEKINCLQNALFYFNNARNYILQIVYCYALEDSKKNYDHKYLQDIMKKDVKEDGVRLKHKLAENSVGKNKIKFDMIYNIMNTIENDEIIKGLVETINYLKHRGMYHIEGLGDNSTTCFENKCFVKIEFDGQKSLNCKPKPLIYRETMSLDTLEKNLIYVKEFFIEQFSKIIEIIKPEVYEKSTNGIYEILRGFDMPLNI